MLLNIWWIWLSSAVGVKICSHGIEEKEYPERNMLLKPIIFAIHYGRPVFGVFMAESYEYKTNALIIRFFNVSLTFVDLLEQFLFYISK